MQIEIVRTTDELERLGRDWNDLASASDMDNPFLQWEWCSAWWRHYGAGHELAVLVARDGGVLIGLAPLYVEDTRRGRVLQFLGTGEVCSEYLGFVLRRGRESEGTLALVDFLLHRSPVRWRLMRLVDVVAGSAFAAAVNTQLGRAGVAYRVEPWSNYWFIKLADTWDGFVQQLSRNRREKIRRARRDMEKHGLEFHEVRDEAELEPAWAELKRLHQMRWQTSGEPGCFASPRFSAFHGELLRPLLRRGMLSLSLLRAGGRTVAASYSLRHRGHVYFYQAGVDPAWKECRPGHVLRVCELRQAIERGDRVYDFLGGDMEYKQQWATDVAPTVQFTVAGRGLVPLAQFRLARAARWVKETARARMPAGSWETLRRWRRRWSVRRASRSTAAEDNATQASRGQY